jgi:hypothetical protein
MPSPAATWAKLLAMVAANQGSSEAANSTAHSPLACFAPCLIGVFGGAFGKCRRRLELILARHPFRILVHHLDRRVASRVAKQMPDPAATGYGKQVAVAGLLADDSSARTEHRVRIGARKPFGSRHPKHTRLLK